MSFSLPVNYIRQWCYCPRKVYYFELTNFQVVYPAWVKDGEDFHLVEQELWKRRNLSRFGLTNGKIYHQFSVDSKKNQLHGIVDMVVVTKDRVYPIEIKINSSNKRRGDVLQLVAYSILLEEHFQLPSDVGFLVGKGKVLHQIKINQKLKDQVLEINQLIKMTIEKGIKPSTSATATQCSACEYLNFCNDRL